MLKAFLSSVKKFLGKSADNTGKPLSKNTSDTAIVIDKIVVKKGTKLSRAVKATKKKPNTLK